MSIENKFFICDFLLFKDAQCTFGLIMLCDVLSPPHDFCIKLGFATIESIEGI